MKHRLHTCLILLAILLAAGPISAQRNKEKDKLSYKERQKFERLYIDASRSKILSDYEQAVKLYEACLKLDPDAAAPYYELANLYLHFNELEEAKANAEKAAEIDSENIYYRIMLAESFKALQDIEGAGREYEGIITDFPDQYGAYLDLALIYILQKDVGKAIETYDKLEESFGPLEEVKLKKQFLYIQKGEVEKAANEIEDLIELFPDNVQYYVLLAELYSANDMEDKAIKAYKKASERFPDNAQIHLSLAHYYNSKQQYKKGLEHLRPAFTNPDLDVDTKVQTMLSLFDIAGREDWYKDEVEALGGLLLETHPKDARVLTLNGDIQLNLGNRRQAQEYFSKAVRQDGSRYPIWSQLLILDAELEDYDTLVAHAQGAAVHFPNQPLCFYFMGFGQSQTDQHKEAAESYETGLRLVVDNDLLKLQFYLGLGDVLNELKEYERSDKAFEDAIALDPENTIALNNYAYYLSERGDKLERALEMSGKALDLEPRSSTYLDTYAWILYKLKRYEEARNYQQQAIDAGGSESDVILEHMGDICFQLKDNDCAMEYWKKARENGQGTPFLDKKLKDGTLYE